MLHILAGQHLRYLVHDGLDLGDVIGVGKGGDQRLHNAEGQNDNRQERLCRQSAMHMKNAAHRQDAEKCRREYRHSGHLSEEAAPHPVDEGCLSMRIAHSFTKHTLTNLVSKENADTKGKGIRFIKYQVLC